MHFLQAPSEPGACVKWASHDQVTKRFCCDEMTTNICLQLTLWQSYAATVSTWWYEVIISARESIGFSISNTSCPVFWKAVLVSLLSRSVRIHLLFVATERLASDLKRNIKTALFILFHLFIYFIYLFCHTGINIMKTIKNRKNRFNNGQET